MVVLMHKYVLPSITEIKTETSNCHFDFLGWLSGVLGRAREASDQGGLA